MGDFAEAQKKADDEAKRAEQKAEQEKAGGLQRVRHLLAQFDSDCHEDYQAYNDQEDGKGGRILTHKTTGQTVHIQSPSRGVYSVNGKNMSGREVVAWMLKEMKA